MPANACCHTKSGVVDTKSGVVDSYYHTRSNEQRGRTGQLVVVEIKVPHVDELADLGGDRTCQRR